MDPIPISVRCIISGPKRRIEELVQLVSPRAKKIFCDQLDRMEDWEETAIIVVDSQTLDSFTTALEMVDAINQTTPSPSAD